MMVTMGWEGGMESYCLLGVKFLSGINKKAPEIDSGDVYMT